MTRSLRGPLLLNLILAGALALVALLVFRDTPSMLVPVLASGLSVLVANAGPGGLSSVTSINAVVGPPKVNETGRVTLGWWLRVKVTAEATVVVKVWVTAKPRSRFSVTATVSVSGLVSLTVLVLGMLSEMGNRWWMTMRNGCAKGVGCASSSPLWAGGPAAIGAWRAIVANVRLSATITRVIILRVIRYSFESG